MLTQFNNALDDVQTKHAFNNDFQTYGEMTEFDKLAIKISEDIKKLEDMREAQK